MDPSEYTVLYFQDMTGGTPGSLDGDDQLVGSSWKTGVNPSISGHVGEAPAKAGKYFAVVIYGEDPYAGQHGDTGRNWVEWKNYSTLVQYKEQAFTVVEESASLEGAYAYQYDATASDHGRSDTEFKYNGGDLGIKFAVGARELVENTDYKLTWLTANPTTSGVTSAGTYEAQLTGIGDFAGTTAKVSFTVEGIDLTKDVVSMDMPTSITGTVSAVTNQIKVNGEPVSTTADPKVEVVSCTRASDGKVFLASEMSLPNTTTGTWVLKVTDDDPANSNVTGYTTITTPVVSQTATFTYDGRSVTGLEFNNSKGTAFNPALLEAKVGSDDVDFTYKVTKDGKEVTSYTEPGEYVLTLDVPVADDFSYGGHQTVKFNVVAKEIGDVDVFTAIDGKVMPSSLPYTGEAYEPSVVVKEGKNTLVAGEDYVVTYEQDGKEVEAMTEVGKYDVVVSFPNSNRADDPVVIPFEVTKAGIVSATPAADFFPTDGETAAVPNFVGYTKADLKGQKFELASDEVSVKYYKADWTDANDANNNGVADADEYVQGDPVKAEDLTEAGMYFADVNVLTTAKNVQGGPADLVLFKVAKQAAFADVDANEWYAQSVYTAASEGYKYMTGLAGTNLFMPNAQITRAQVAQVFFNMAGGDEFDATKVSYDDLVSGAWYGPAIAWASQAGIVTGYAGTNNFGPEDPATREQVATMIYRYMKAQGKDVSVKDEAAALAKYADGASVSDFAKTAMAYCVEQGIFGVDVDSLRPQDNLSRAEMAATSVRVQPDGAYTEL